MPKRTRTDEKPDVFQNVRGVFVEAVESAKLTAVQQVMREMAARGGKIGAS